MKWVGRSKIKKEKVSIVGKILPDRKRTVKEKSEKEKPRQEWRKEKLLFKPSSEVRTGTRYQVFEGSGGWSPCSLQHPQSRSCPPDSPHRARHSLGLSHRPC